MSPATRVPPRADAVASGRRASARRGRPATGGAGRPRGTATLVAHRLVQIPVVLLVVSVLVFVLIQVVPGDPGRNALGPYATADQVAAWNAAHGFSAGIVERYSAWLGGFVTGQWGTSAVYGVPVLDLVLGRLLNSVVLGLLAFAVLVPLAIGIGALQARVEGTATDRGLTVGLLSLGALPEFVIGVVLLVTFAVALPILPVQSAVGAEADVGRRLLAMVLPALTLALGAVAAIARTTRTGVVDTLTSAHYRAAVVRGLPGGALFRRHVVRNALVPTVSVLALSLGALLGGSAVVETLFGYPGLGELLVTATQRKDVAVLAAGVMVTGGVTLLALAAADVAFTLVDPRVRFGRRS